MKYEIAEDLQAIAEELAKHLFLHIKIERVKCFRSYGSSSRGTIARCHALGKLMQLAIGVKAHYALEFIHERFDKLGKEEQIKTIIHELMHIPKTFGGGFRHHDYVCEKNVNKFYKEYLRLINLKEKETRQVNIINEFYNPDVKLNNLSDKLILGEETDNINPIKKKLFNLFNKDIKLDKSVVNNKVVSQNKSGDNNQNKKIIWRIGKDGKGYFVEI